ncbi:uncharacterized protein LOC114749365 isoform X3 [Neltuma alba]|uniref:uncharacterized protein LOC114749365 isoform X3 n=1 Tax=Neltuma alba TaxID=207710 RepID=UPI0010A2AAC0|nr:uncharacterized protein LOC114749365 isoform X3 [Prosopis alba]
MTPEFTMAEQEEEEDNETKNLVSSYIGIGFSLFLAFLPKNLLPLFHKLGSQLKELSAKLFQAEEQLKQMKSRRQEDSKANARVVEIFASHRNTWQVEEKRLLHQIDTFTEEIAHLRARVAEFEKYKVEWKTRIGDLQRDVRQKEKMLNLISRREQEEDEDSGACESRDYGGGAEKVEVIYEQNQKYQRQETNFEFVASASKYSAERDALWQGVPYESPESTYDMTHGVAREPPWKVDGGSAGVYSKLKLLERGLLNLEKTGKSDLSKVPSLIRKQAMRYRALAEKIDELCGRIQQASNPCETALSSEFQTQKQTEFLLEAFRLQQQASETGQNLMALQTETGKSYDTVAARRAMDSSRNNMKEIQRNLEIWLARIIGDLEGILARDGAAGVREYYVSRYPFIQ